MKTIHLFLLVLVTCASFSCKKNVATKSTVDIQIVIDSVEVLKKKLLLNQIKGAWYFMGEPFNGYSVKYHSNGALAERLGFYKGKREGTAKRWSANGKLLVESHYKNNRLHGRYTTWWDNQVAASEANYENGKINGIEKQWYASGQLAKVRNLVDGKEHGLQKAWLENGILYVNYEAKNGRIFGMRRANSCYQLKDEQVVQSKL